MTTRPIRRSPLTRRRRGAALAACSLLLLVLLPALHAVAPGHDHAAAHACPLCLNLLRATDALPADASGTLRDEQPVSPLALIRLSFAPSDGDHRSASPRAPPRA